MGCKICKELFNENELNLRNENDNTNNSYRNNNKNGLNEKTNINRENYIKEVINYNNIKRKEHNVPPLTELKELDNIAQNYSKKISTSNDLNNSQNMFKGDLLGESLFSSNRPIKASKLVDNWYLSGQNYNESNPQPSNYTQMIWKNSKYIGIGITQGNNGYTYVVANYYPGGNIEKEFKENVLSKKNLNLYGSNILSQSNNNNNFEIEYNENNNNIKPKDNTNIDNVEFTSEEFANDALKAHNIYREKHHVPPVKLNKEICLLAQKHANMMAINEEFIHSHNTYKDEELAENLFMWIGYEITGQNVVENWYNEGKDYDYEGDFQKGCGHFTQIIWKDTKEVGFACALSKNGTYYAVGHYYPPGNFIGEFGSNVFPP
jgi:uncharacterized protein YkwD